MRGGEYIVSSVSPAFLLESESEWQRAEGWMPWCDVMMQRRPVKPLVADCGTNQPVTPSAAASQDQIWHLSSDSGNNLAHKRSFVLHTNSDGKLIKVTFCKNPDTNYPVILMILQLSRFSSDSYLSKTITLKREKYNRLCIWWTGTLLLGCTLRFQQKYIQTAFWRTTGEVHNLNNWKNSYKWMNGALYNTPITKWKYYYF